MVATWVSTTPLQTLCRSWLPKLTPNAANRNWVFYNSRWNKYYSSNNASAGESAASADDEQNNTEYGVSLRNGPFGLHLTRENAETKSSAGLVTADIKTNEVGATYQVADDLQVGLISVSSEDSISTGTPDLGMMVYGANYTIFPGMRLQASYADFDYQGVTDNKGSSTTIRLRMDF